MSYNDLRHFADSWGLVLMTLAFLTLVAWPFLRSRDAQDRAANSIFEEEDENHG